MESHELRLAFEDVAGQDLNWFFNQWFFAAGHPVLEIAYGWDAASKKASVSVSQMQESEGVTRVFNIPLSVDVYDSAGNATRQNIRLTKRNQTFYFDCASKPALVNFDATKSLLCEKIDQHTQEEWAFMYRHAPLFRDRIEALEGLQAEPSELADAVYKEALSDKFYAIRQQAMSADIASDPSVLPLVVRMAQTDTEPGVRVQAINLLSRTGDAQYRSVYEQNMGEDQSYSVVGAALYALQDLDPEAALAASKSLENDDSDAFVPILSELYASKPDVKHLGFFEKHLAKTDGYGAFRFFDNYQKLLVGLGDEKMLDEGIARFNAISLNLETSEWRRFGATKAIADVRNHFQEKGNSIKANALNALIEAIKAKETDPTLLLYYGMF